MHASRSMTGTALRTIGQPIVGHRLCTMCGRFASHRQSYECFCAIDAIRRCFLLTCARGKMFSEFSMRVPDSHNASSQSVRAATNGRDGPWAAASSRCSRGDRVPTCRTGSRRQRRTPWRTHAAPVRFAAHRDVRGHRMRRNWRASAPDSPDSHHARLTRSRWHGAARLLRSPSRRCRSVRAEAMQRQT